MSLSQVANLAEKVLGHSDNAITEQNASNPGRDRAKYAHASGEKMKALTWVGQGKVALGMIFTIPDLDRVFGHGSVVLT